MTESKVKVKTAVRKKGSPPVLISKRVEKKEVFVPADDVPEGPEKDEESDEAREEER